MNAPKQICLEKEFDYLDCKNAYKLDMDHYKAVLQAKWEKGILNYVGSVNYVIPIDLVGVGDFIKIFIRNYDGGGKYYYGFVQKNDVGYFIISGYLFGNNDIGWSYIHRKTYLHGEPVTITEIVWKHIEREANDDVELQFAIAEARIKVAAGLSAKTDRMIAEGLLPTEWVEKNILGIDN